jgi:hypothetical protein
MPSTVRAHDRRERQHGSDGLAGGAAGAGLIAAGRWRADRPRKGGSLALTRDTSEGFDAQSQVARLKNWPGTDDVRTKLCVHDEASVVVLDLDA